MNRRQFLTTSLGLFFVPSIIGRAMASPPTVPKRKLKGVWTVECEQDLLNLHDVSSDLAKSKFEVYYNKGSYDFDGVNWTKKKFDEPHLMGYRGIEYMKPGIVYAPWIPLQYDSGSK